MKIALLVLVLAGAVSGADAQAVAPGQTSPRVTFDPYERGAYPPTARRLTPAELKGAREQAERLFEVVRATPGFARPVERVSLATGWTTVGADGTLEHDFTVYWSRAFDVRVRADGAFQPVLGGAHEMLYLTTNRPPAADHLVDAATRGNFSRGIGEGGRTAGAFAMPRVLGERGGGTLYADLLVLTRDGRSALEPAPIGPLLEGEVRRLRPQAEALGAGAVRALQELEASMTPEAIAARRAKRAEAWKRETRDPDALAKRLDAAARTDEWDAGRQRERLAGAGSGGGVRQALHAAEARLASLDAAARRAPACGRTDPAAAAGFDVRFEPLDGAPAGCIPMVQVRRDLVDPKRPPGEVQLLTLWSRESLCGIPLAAGTVPASGRCAQVVPLLRDLDWAALRRAVGW